jgi:hypothetical protein
MPELTDAEIVAQIAADNIDANQGGLQPIGDGLANSMGLQSMQDDPSLMELQQQQREQGTNRQVADPAEEKRFQFWQAQADKARRELAAAQQELQIVRPIVGVIQNDDTLRATVQQRLAGTQSREPELVPPVAPEKPDGYNDADAFSNKESTSYKFRLALEKFRDDKLNFIEKKAELAEKRLQERELQLRQQSEQQQFLSETERYVVEKHGMRPEEARAFVIEMSRDDAMNTDDLVEYWKLKRQMGARRGDNLRGMPPVPPTGGGGTGRQPINLDAQFNSLMFGPPKRR